MAAYSQAGAEIVLSGQGTMMDEEEDFEEEMRKLIDEIGLTQPRALTEEKQQQQAQEERHEQLMFRFQDMEEQMRTLHKSMGFLHEQGERSSKQINAIHVLMISLAIGLGIWFASTQDWRQAFQQAFSLEGLAWALLVAIAAGVVSTCWVLWWHVILPTWRERRQRPPKPPKPEREAFLIKGSMWWD